MHAPTRCKRAILRAPGRAAALSRTSHAGFGAAGILRGVRGPRGGYRLARERRRISVREIFEVIEDIDGNDVDMLSKSDLGRVVIAPFHANMQEALIGAVGDTTIADLCSQADSTGGDDKADFTITKPFQPNK